MRSRRRRPRMPRAVAEAAAVRRRARPKRMTPRSRGGADEGRRAPPTERRHGGPGPIVARATRGSAAASKTAQGGPAPAARRELPEARTSSRAHAVEVRPRPGARRPRRGLLPGEELRAGREVGQLAADRGGGARARVLQGDAQLSPEPLQGSGEGLSGRPEARPHERQREEGLALANKRM